MSYSLQWFHNDVKFVSPPSDRFVFDEIKKTRVSDSLEESSIIVIESDPLMKGKDAISGDQVIRRSSDQTIERSNDHLHDGSESLTKIAA